METKRGDVFTVQKYRLWDSSGCPLAKTLTPSAEGPSSIPGQGTRSPMLQLRPGQINIRYFLRVVFFLNSVKGHGDLLLTLYMVTWTVCPW